MNDNKESKIEKELKELKEQYKQLFELAVDAGGYIQGDSVRHDYMNDIKKYRPKKE